MERLINRICDLVLVASTLSTIMFWTLIIYIGGWDNFRLFFVNLF